MQEWDLSDDEGSECSDEGTTAERPHRDWFCPTCTYRNEGELPACSMCGTVNVFYVERERIKRVKAARVEAAAAGSRRARQERESFLASSEQDLAELDALQQPLVLKRCRPGRGFVLPLDLAVRSAYWLQAREIVGLRAVCSSLVACAESEELYGTTYWAAKKAATMARRERAWGCLSRGWRWICESATVELVEAAASFSRGEDETVDDGFGEVLAELGELGRLGDESALRRASRRTCFESLDESVRSSWRKAIDACCRRDPELLADCLDDAATMVAEQLSRTEPDILRAASLFESWTCGLERAVDVLEGLRSPQAPSLRSRSLAAFRAAYLYAVRPNIRHLECLEARIEKCLPPGLHKARLEDAARNLFAGASELANDHAFHWAVQKLVERLGPFTSLAVDHERLCGILAEIDAHADLTAPNAASFRNDIRARFLLPLRAIQLAGNRRCLQLEVQKVALPRRPHLAADDDDDDLTHPLQAPAPGCRFWGGSTRPRSSRRRFPH